MKFGVSENYKQEINELRELEKKSEKVLIEERNQCTKNTKI